MRRRRRRRAAASPREGPQAASLRKLRPELCAYRGYRSRSRTHGEGGWPATRVRLVQSLRKQLPEYMVCCRKIDLIRGRQPAAALWRRAVSRLLLVRRFANCGVSVIAQQWQPQPLLAEGCFSRPLVAGPSARLRVAQKSHVSAAGRSFAARRPAIRARLIASPSQAPARGGFPRSAAG